MGTWAEINKKARSMEKYVNEVPPPPEPDDSFAEAMHTTKAGINHLVEVTTRRAESEADRAAGLEEDE